MFPLNQFDCHCSMPEGDRASQVRHSKDLNPVSPAQNSLSGDVGFA